MGMPYGIANRTGQPNLRNALAIIRSARDHGIREYDTAQAYGRSEEVLGQALRKIVVGDKAKVSYWKHCLRMINGIHDEGS
jgi:aryl-alcohol dehydrogenase-like predicted oxidoreductase